MNHYLIYFSYTHSLSLPSLSLSPPRSLSIAIEMEVPKWIFEFRIWNRTGIRGFNAYIITFTYCSHQYVANTQTIRLRSFIRLP